MIPYWKSVGICIEDSGKIINCGIDKYRWNLVGVKIYKATNRFARLIAKVNSTGLAVPRDNNSQCAQIVLKPFNSYDNLNDIKSDLNNYIAEAACNVINTHIGTETNCNNSSPPICQHARAIAKLKRELELIVEVYEKASPSEISQDSITISGREESPLKPYIPDNRITLTTGVVFAGLFDAPDKDQKKFQDFIIPIIAQFNISKIFNIDVDCALWRAFSLDLGHGLTIVDTPDPRNDVQRGKNWLFGFSLTSSGISLSAGFYVFENQENQKFNTTLYIGLTLDLQKAAWLLKQLGFTDGQVPTLK
jgi:hypothetical protein